MSELVTQSFNFFSYQTNLWQVLKNTFVKNCDSFNDKVTLLLSSGFVILFDLFTRVDYFFVAHEIHKNEKIKMKTSCFLKINVLFQNKKISWYLAKK